MEFSEYLGILIPTLALLVAVISVWLTKGKKSDSEILNAFLVCIFIIGLIIIVISTRSYISTPEPTEPPEKTGTVQTDAMGTRESTAPTMPETAVPSVALIPDNIKIGETFPFGTYEEKSINWLVLAKEENRILVLSECGLDSQLFHKTYKSVTWETSTIRDWCEGFYDKAFNDEEQKLIQLTTLQPGTCPASGCDKGNGTQDHVFLLSLDEVNTYIIENGRVGAEALLCRPTEYAVEQGAYKNGTGYGWWWLRTSTNNNCYACSVNSDGSLDLSNGKVNSPNAVVRPAMWLYIGS